MNASKHLYWSGGVAAVLLERFQFIRDAVAAVVDAVDAVSDGDAA